MDVVTKSIENILENHIKASIKSDIALLLKEKNEDGPIGGFFAVPMLVFAQIEYLGSLRYGKGSSANAVKFIREYLGRTNKRYQEIGGLLFDMFRHGTVHEREPKIYIFDNFNGFMWEIVKNERFAEHLSLRKGLYLVLIIDVLYEDLLKAIDYFLDDLKKDIEMQSTFIDARNRIKAPKKVSEVKADKGKRYITDDFEKVGKVKNIFSLVPKNKSTENNK